VYDACIPARSKPYEERRCCCCAAALSTAVPQNPPQPIKTCHTLIGELLHADVTTASHSDLADVRKLLTVCVADREEEMTKNGDVTPTITGAINMHL